MGVRVRTCFQQVVHTMNVPIGFGGRGFTTQLGDRRLDLVVFEPNSLKVEFLDVQSVSDFPAGASAPS